MNYVKKGETPLSYVLCAVQPVLSVLIQDWQWALSSHSVSLYSRLVGMFMFWAGPAHGRKPEHLAKQMQVLAQLFIEVISPHVTTAICVQREEMDPLWYVKLSAFVKGIGLSIWAPPCRFLSGFVECAKLRAARKSSSSNIQQSGRGAHLAQQSAFQKSFSSNSS